MLYVKIDENNEPVGDLISVDRLKQELGPNVSLPRRFNDTHINPLGYACVEETYVELEMDKTTYLKPKLVKKIPDPEAMDNYMFTREWELVPYPDNVEIRVAERFRVIRAERDRLLAETDFAATADYYYMKDQYTEYRNALRDMTDQNEDPFLIRFPEKPVDPKDDFSFEGRKLYALYKCEEKFRRTLYNPSEIDTGLGFAVVGGSQNYSLIKGARDIGVFIVFDTENNKHDVSKEDMDAIINAFEMFYQEAFNTKKQFEEAIAEADEMSIEDVIREIKS